MYTTCTATACTIAAGWNNRTDFLKGDLIPGGIKSNGWSQWNQLEHLFWAQNESNPGNFTGLPNMALSSFCSMLLS
jgi:hypothetical protein